MVIGCVADAERAQIEIGLLLPAEVGVRCNHVLFMTRVVGLIVVVAVFVAGRHAKAYGIGSGVGAENMTGIPVLACGIDVI